MARMKALMLNLRTAPPSNLGGLAVQGVRDFLCLPDSPKGDLIILDLAEPAHYVAIRPSGTEPKIKFYLFTHVAAEQLHLLEEAQAECDRKLSRMESDLRQLAAQA
jgi:phosphoglucomutase/phosphomannomutase